MPDSLDPMFARARDLEVNGLDRSLAFGTAWLEERIRAWPAGYGDDLRVLIYGDFAAPEAQLSYPQLGITIHPDKKEKTIVRGAMTVLEANVAVSERSVAGLTDAIRRLNTLLGAFVLHGWGNTSIGWWSWVTHGTGSGVLTKLVDADVEQTAKTLAEFPAEVRRKVEAAMFWIREPRNLLLESYRSDALRVYAAYWNAFECLVDAVDFLRPYNGPTKSEKQSLIDAFVAERGGRLTAADIQKCYQTVVNPGLVARASHVLSVSFGADGARYVDECFKREPREDRLYDIRNAINHGDIDAENPTELLRVEARLSRLWMIVWRMFGRLIPFPAPADMSNGQ